MPLAAVAHILVVRLEVGECLRVGPYVTLRTSLTLLALFGIWPASAAAYCRTYTCQSDDTCEFDGDCLVGGQPVRWPSGCVTFAVQRTGSRAQGLDADDVLKVAKDAFAIWTDSECHRGGSPPLTFINLGEVGCNQPEYNCDPKDWNANVIMFRDDGWVHAANALAITCLSMNLDTGELLDTDIEINTSADFEFSLPGGNEGADLRTVLMHEAGHVLGLDHPGIPGTVMHGFYDSTALYSSLSDDDRLGICDIYGGEDSDPKCKAPKLPKDTECVGGSACVPQPGDEYACSCREGGAPRGEGSAPIGWGVLSFTGAFILRRRLLSAPTYKKI